MECVFLLALQIDGRTDGRTYTFFKYPCYTDSSGIQHSVDASINTVRQRENRSPE